MNVFLAAALMLLCVAGSTAAQPVATVAGSVVDQTGATLPGVRLTIRGGADRTAESGAAGDFVFPDLAEGDYELSHDGERVRRVAALSGPGRSGRFTARGSDEHASATDQGTAPGRERLYMIALTGFIGADIREGCLAAGFDEHLTKPGDIHKLAQLLGRDRLDADDASG